MLLCHSAQRQSLTRPSSIDGSGSCRGRVGARVAWERDKENEGVGVDAGGGAHLGSWSVHPVSGEGLTEL